MIPWLAGAALVLFLALWISFMYAWWQKEQGVASARIDFAPVVLYWQKIERMVRRGWYGSRLYAAIAATWSNKKLAEVFFRVFPRARQAFAERDMLTGLEQGPSSYFLLSISESEEMTRTKK